MGKRFPGKVPAVFDGSRLISQLSHYCVFMVFFFFGAFDGNFFLFYRIMFYVFGFERRSFGP